MVGPSFSKKINIKRGLHDAHDLNAKILLFQCLFSKLTLIGIDIVFDSSIDDAVGDAVGLSSVDDDVSSSGSHSTSSSPRKLIFKHLT